MSSPLTIGSALSRSSMPTCTWMPQIIIWRPHHCVRSSSRSYRSFGVTFWSYHWAKGCVPAHISSTPSGSVTPAHEPDELLQVGDRSRNRAVHRLTSSTVFRSSSWVICGCSCAVRRPELAEHLVGDLDEVAGGAVDQRELPLDADGGALGFREFDLHAVVPSVRLFKGRQYLTE